ncbi:MAG: tetratricopeptide repeat protein, partial [Planctomycetota bacterium]
MRQTLRPLLLLLVLLAASCAGSPSSEPAPRPRPPSGEPKAEDGDAPSESEFERQLREGLARFDAKDLAGAELRIECALRIDPWSPEAWNALARVAYERGDMELCVERADRALRIAPDHREARLNRGLALFGMRNYGAAHTEFRRIVAYPVEEGRIADYSLAY